jgi:hypothetical protein
VLLWHDAWCGSLQRHVCIGQAVISEAVGNQVFCAVEAIGWEGSGHRPHFFALLALIG